MLLIGYVLWLCLILDVFYTTVDPRYLIIQKDFLKMLWDIRTSTYQIGRIEEKINRTARFDKWICNLTSEVRDIMKILWNFPTMFCYLLLDFHFKTGTRFSLWDKRFFKKQSRVNESRLYFHIPYLPYNFDRHTSERRAGSYQPVPKVVSSGLTLYIFPSSTVDYYLRVKWTCSCWGSPLSHHIYPKYLDSQAWSNSRAIVQTQI